MSTVLFICILLGCTLAVRHIRFLAAPGLSANKLSLLFLLKAAAGMLLGWIYARYSTNGGDYWSLHHNGLAEMRLLKQDPVIFITDLFNSPYPKGWGGFFDSVGSHWNNLRNTIIEKLLGMMNLITGGNFYSNTVLFDFMGFFGPVALYRTWQKVYPEHETSLMISCFLLPSPLIFLSGLHKDLFIFTFTCFVIYFLYQIIYDRCTRSRCLLLSISFLFLLLLRNYVAIALIPAACALWLTGRGKMKKLPAFSLIYSGTILIIAGASILFPGKGPLHILIKKHQDFSALKEARSQLPMFELEESLSSLVKNLPQALNHVLLKPDPLHSNNFFHLAFSIEMIILIALILLALLLERKQNMPSFTLFLVCVAITGLLFIGFVVPNGGSIIRYRSFYLPFLIVPALVGLARQRQIKFKNM